MSVPLARPCVGVQELKGIEGVLASGWLGLGPTVARFEQAVAAFVGAKNCVAVNSGTAALHLALEAVGVRDGEVIVPSMTYAATIQAIVAAGGTPVFAECRVEDLNLDVADAERRITNRTRAIVAVHYAGTPVDMSCLQALSKRHGVVLVEDAAHAFGSTYKGAKVGSFGDLTCFSFDPIKTITCGEGGAVCTPSDAWAARVRQMRVLGISKRSPQRLDAGIELPYLVVGPGLRYHMSDINAAIGLAQMAKAPELISQRQRIAAQYDAAFRELSSVILLSQDRREQVPFCYTIRVIDGKRSALMAALARCGIETAVLYPPNHLQPAFASFHTPLPVTESVAREHLSLPLFAGMTETQVDHVIECVVTACQRGNLPL